MLDLLTQIIKAIYYIWLCNLDCRMFCFHSCHLSGANWDKR